MRKCQQADIPLSRGQSASLLSKQSSADSKSGSFFTPSSSEMSEDLYSKARPGCWLPSVGEPKSPTHFTTVVHWDSKYFLSHAHRKHKESQLNSFLWCLGARWTQTISTAPPFIVDGLSRRLSNITAETALNKMAVTKPSGTFELFFPPLRCKFSVCTALQILNTLD